MFRVTQKVPQMDTVIITKIQKPTVDLKEMNIALVLERPIKRTRRTVTEIMIMMGGITLLIQILSQGKITRIFSKLSVS